MWKNYTCFPTSNSLSSPFAKCSCCFIHILYCLNLPSADDSGNPTFVLPIRFDSLTSAIYSYARIRGGSAVSSSFTLSTTPLFSLLCYIEIVIHRYLLLTMTTMLCFSAGFCGISSLLFYTNLLMYELLLEYLLLLCVVWCLSKRIRQDVVRMMRNV